MLRTLLCFLFGHPDSVIVWGPWRDDLEVGRYRVLTEQCTRCQCVLGLSSLVEGQPWTP